MDYELLIKDRRVVLGAGAALALAAGIGIAAAIMSGDKGTDKPPPASRAGLVVETGRADDGKLDPARPLRCFVAGQFAGELTLAECAQRNGVATGALDVGVDETGALAAADVAGTVLTPLPPIENTPPPATIAQAPPQPSVSVTTSAPGATCWRYSGAEWRQVGDMGRGACVQTLFAGQCERRGAATYGRWGSETLRLVTGRVEVSADNRRFRTLVEQGPGCSIPSID